MAFKLKAPFLNTPPGVKGTVLPEVEVTYHKSQEDDGWTDKTKAGHVGSGVYKPKGDDQDFVRVKSAANMGTPLHDKDKLSAGSSNVDFTGGLGQQDDPSSSLEVEDVDADGVTNTETEPEEDKSNIEKFNEELEGSEDENVDNKFLRDRIDQARNPRQEAKLKLRLARRQKRQTESAKRKYAKQNMELGLEEGVLDLAELNPDDQAYYKEKGFKSKAEQAAEAAGEDNKDAQVTTDEPPVQAAEAVIMPILKQAAVGAISDKMKEKMKDEAPTNYKPNRAGRSKESGVLQMSPALKSHKQSHKGAVGMMKMQSIAQDLGPINMNAGFEALPKDVQENILKNQK